MVPKHLLQVSVREPRNNLVRSKIYGGILEAKDEDDNIIISDSTLYSLFPPQFKTNIQDTRSCVVANAVYLPKIFIYQYCHGMIFILKF